MTFVLNPYLAFAGNAREALEFYQGILGGQLELSTFGELGAPADSPQATQVMHGQLRGKGFTLMGSDTMAAEATPTPSSQGTFSVSLSGDATDGLADCFTKLSAGGTVSVPLEKQAWGDEFGQCVDKFGVAWMVNITPQSWTTDTRFS